MIYALFCGLLRVTFTLFLMVPLVGIPQYFFFNFWRHLPLYNPWNLHPSIASPWLAQAQAQSSMLPLLHLELHEIHRHFSCLCSSGDSLVRRSLPAANFPEVPHYSTALIKLPHLLTKCEIYI